MKHRLFQRLLTGVLACFLIASCAVPALAAGTAGTYARPELDRPTSLSIHYHQRNIDFDNVRFRVYKIADMTETVRFEFVDRFKNYPVDFQDEMTASEWSNLAEILAGYVSRDNLKPDYEGVTDKDGEYSIPGLDASLYLVMGDSHQREYRTTERGESVLHRVYYHAAPFLVSTPTLDEKYVSESQWQYDVGISPKFSASEDEFISRRVLKTWDDVGYESQRPGALVFDLICDNEIAETVELTAGDLWRYQWDELDNTHQWRIVEHGAGNYRVSGRQEGVTYVVTNRYNYPETDRPGTANPNNPDDPVRPVPPTENIPDDPTPSGDKPDLPQKPDPDETIPDWNIPKNDLPKLPQTGQLWWPVPVLAFSGITLFFLGWLMRRRIREDRHEG